MVAYFRTGGSFSFWMARIRLPWLACCSLEGELCGCIISIVYLNPAIETKIADGSQGGALRRGASHPEPSSQAEVSPWAGWVPILQCSLADPHLADTFSVSTQDPLERSRCPSCIRKAIQSQRPPILGEDANGRGVPLLLQEGSWPLQPHGSH